jgi:hypothetical protein
VGTVEHGLELDCGDGIFKKTGLVGAGQKSIFFESSNDCAGVGERVA